MTTLIDIRDMSDEELKAMLEEVRLTRKSSFERKKRKTTHKQDSANAISMLASMSEEDVKALLEELQKQGAL